MEYNGESAALLRKHEISEARLRRLVSWVGVFGTMAFGTFSSLTSYSTP